MMRKKICTSISQSRHLLQAGVDPKTADMTWIHSRFTPKRAYGEDHHMLFAYPGATTGNDPVGCPAWSAAALVSLLPESIPNKYNREKDCVLFIGKDKDGDFIASYDADDESHVPTCAHGADLVDVLFRLYCKVTDNEADIEDEWGKY